jgi:hypothetical protein
MVLRRGQINFRTGLADLQPVRVPGLVGLAQRIGIKARLRP